MRPLILCLLSVTALLAAEPVKDAKDTKDKSKKVEEAAITPLIREFLSAIYQAGALPTQEQCDKPLQRLLAKGPYDYDTPAARTDQRVKLSQLIKRQGQPSGMVELGHWNYLEKAERVWYMIPCQHGMFFMQLVTTRLPDGRTPIVTSFDFSDNINSVPTELVKPQIVVIKQAEGEGDKTLGEKPAEEKKTDEKKSP